MGMGNRKQTNTKRSVLHWLSKAVLLAVAPWTAAQFVLEFHAWGRTLPMVAWITLAICVAMAALVWKLRAGTAGAAAMGAAILGCLIWGTIQFPYTNWLRTGLTPLGVTLVLTLTATKIGQRMRGETGSREVTLNREATHGRDAAQVAANLGVAAVAVTLVPFAPEIVAHNPSFAALVAFSALAEAAADTVSSEIGRSFGGTPRLVTSWRRVPAGTDGAVTALGTLAGAVAAALVAGTGIWSLTGALRGQQMGLWLILVGGCAGWLLDSLLGATLERRGWLNNDAVNFLSTGFAGVVTLVLARGLAALLLHPRG